MPGLFDQNIAWRPHHYPWAIEAASLHERMHWGSWEANLQEDVNQWKSNALTDIEKNHITQILRAFTQSDIAVASNYIDKFLPKFKNNEIRHMLLSFANREGEHQRSYALLNDTLGFPESEFTAFLEYKEMAEKIEFMTETDVSSISSTAFAVAKSAINEGMSLFSAFAMLLSYARFGKMKGMSEIVSWSIRDETMHSQYMCQLFRTICDEHPRIVNDDFKKSIYQMVRDAVALEDKFIDLAFKLGEPHGQTKAELKQYIRHIADRILVRLGLKANWHVKQNPLPWIEWMVSGDSFGNFFERKITDYSKTELVGDDWGYPTNESAEAS